MKFKYLTLTGADDRTDPIRMAEISREFPFVEWAILFNPNKIGVPRYPTINWVNQTLSKLASDKINLSAHLCGGWVENATKGKITFLDQEFSRFFGRVQFNMYGDRLRKVLDPKSDFWKCNFSDRQFILGGPYKLNNIDAHQFFSKFNICPLFDCSGGRGLSPTNWPKSKVYTNGLAGYAGGLGPDNIETELLRIKEVAEDSEIWIDMEKKLRNEQNELDLDKCVEVLSKAKSILQL